MPRDDGMLHVNCMTPVQPVPVRSENREILDVPSLRDELEDGEGQPELGQAQVELRVSKGRVVARLRVEVRPTFPDVRKSLMY